MKRFFILSLSVCTPLAFTSCKNEGVNNNEKPVSVPQEQGETILTSSETQNDSTQKSKVTDGRDYLGSFAPQFAAINDDVLFGQVWSREEELSARDRSIITLSALMGAGITDHSLKSHIEKAKQNGVTKSEIVEIITQLAFYTGWAVFAQAMEVYGEGSEK